MDLQVFDLPLRILRIPGIDPSDNSLLAKMKRFISCSTFFVVLTTAVMEMQRREWSVTSIVGEVESIVMTMEVELFEIQLLIMI